MKKTCACRVVILAGILLLMPAALLAQKSEARKPAPQPPRAAAPAARKPAPQAVKAEAPAAIAGVHYNSEGRRDPFFNYQLLKNKVTENPDEEIPRGTAPPGIAGMFMAQVKLLGIAASEENMTAVVGGTDGRAYFLQEKDALFDGYLKKIEADSVILIRETRLRSGKVITQEVVKRLRTP